MTEIAYVKFFNLSREWMIERLAVESSDAASLKRQRIRRAILCAVLFLLASGVRLLHWQDSGAAFEQGKILPAALIRSYEREADRISDQGSILFPQETVDEGDARMIVHPPGYSILIAAMTDRETRSYTRLRLFQILLDSLSTTVVFLIAAELLPLAAAFIAGLLTALSPHLAYYSLWLTPESAAVLPVLLAVYLTLRNSRHRLISAAVAGVCVGVACWLRANCLLLAPFLAIMILLLFERGKKLRAAGVMVAAALAVIAPITIRNYVVYGRFIPLSLGSGITLVEGIADYDTEERFGMPDDDRASLLKDVEWHNRPDYGGNLWSPDGVERDRARFARGFSVIRSNPGWFLGVMLRRSAFMLRYNGSGSQRWPMSTANVPVISSEPQFGHAVSMPEDAQPALSVSPTALMAEGEKLEAEVSIIEDGRLLEVAGDESAFADQFASAPVAVKKNTDYVLTLRVKLNQGRMAVKVTDAARRIALASTILEIDQKRSKKKKQDEAEGEQTLSAIEMPFASGDRNEVRIVISNNGRSEERSVAELGEAQLFEAGPTPYQWTRLPRIAVRGIQKNLFVTSRLLPIIAIGIALLALARRKKEIVLLLAVPFYYLCFQSILHTEYRYILTIHYFLFIFAAVALYFFGAMIRLAAGRLTRREE